MSTINTVKQVQDTSHLNWMGGKSYFIKNPIATLRMAASSCFFGEPQYYHADKTGKFTKGRVVYTGTYSSMLDESLEDLSSPDWKGLSTSELMEKAIDKALDYSIEQTLALAAELRDVWHIRVTPQVILVRAANHKKSKGTGLIRQYASQIIKRADEPATGLAYQLSAYEGKPIPNSLKKSWKDFLENASEYSVAKYRMDNRVVKTVDVVNLVHAKGEVINRLSKGELKNASTWESIISAKGSNKEAWSEAIDVMGHMALLRNLRNLLEKGLDPALFVQKLKAGVAGGKQLPFRYYSAYKAVEGLKNPLVLDAIEECMKLSLDNLPKFKGKTISLADNSGSAQGATTSSMDTMKVSSIANLTAILTGMVAEEGYLGVFGDKLEILPVRKTSSIFDQLKKADEVAYDIGTSTENGIWLFWKNAIKNKEHYDNVFIYSDMQAGHGGLFGLNPGDYKEFAWGSGENIDVAKLIRKYRNTVNANVNVFLVQVAGYQDTIVPEFYNRTYILGGWSDAILKFADAMINPSSNNIKQQKS